jgi:hypothetical protein
LTTTFGVCYVPDQMKLYWVTTPEHTEDWFVFADSKRRAERFFELSDGFNFGDSSAELILGSPKCDVKLLCEEHRKEYDSSQACWGWESDLRARGATILRWKTPNKVQFGSRVFTEGGLQYFVESIYDDDAESRGEGRGHGTVKDNPI